MLGVQLADVSTRCSSHPQGKSALSIKLSTKNLHCFYIATASESNVASTVTCILTMSVCLLNYEIII